jgi:hypothetical protein
LSVTFDRASYQPTIIQRRGGPRAQQRLSYIDCMRMLCLTGLEIVQSRSIPQSKSDQLVRITGWRTQINTDMQQVLPHLQDIAACVSMREQLEYWNLYMHRSYTLSELSRSALNPRGMITDDKILAKSLRSLCIDSLADTVEAYLGLQNITRFATHSWAAIHRSLSSALLLGVLGEASRVDRVHTLVSRLHGVISDIISGLDPSEQSAPLTRAHEALQKFIHQSSDAQSSEAEAHFDLFAQGGFYPSDLDTPLSGSDIGSGYEVLFSESKSSPYSMVNGIIWGI